MHRDTHPWAVSLMPTDRAASHKLHASTPWTSTKRYPHCTAAMEVCRTVYRSKAQTEAAGTHFYACPPPQPPPSRTHTNTTHTGTCTLKYSSSHLSLSLSLNCLLMLIISVCSIVMLICVCSIARIGF